MSDSWESTDPLLLLCDFLDNLQSLVLCSGSIGLCLRGCWICWLVGKGALANIVMLTYGRIHYTSCGLLERTQPAFF